MKVLDRKLFRDLLGAKLLLLAIMGIIAAGTTCFIAFLENYRNLERARKSYYTHTRMADFSVQCKKIPIGELHRLENVDGIVAYRPRILFEVTVDLDDVPQPLAGRVLSLPDDRQRVINDIVMRQGSYFSEQRREEVIVNEAFARARNIGPGDRIRLILNNRRQELVVVGTAISSEFVYLAKPGALIPAPAAYGVFYLKNSYAEEVFDFEGACNQVVGLLDRDYQHRADAVLDEIEIKLDEFGVASTTPRRLQPSHRFLEDEINGLGVTATFLPAIFLSVAAVVLNVLMTRMAEQQRTIVGTLKALGYRNSQVFAHFAKFSLAIGCLGGLVGDAAGYFLGGQLTALYRQYYKFPVLENHAYPDLFVYGILISVSFALLGAVRGARAVLKLKPAEAMRSKPPVLGRGIWLEHWRWFWSNVGFGWRLVLRDLFRNRMRTLAGLFASAMGAVLMMTSFASMDAIDHLVKFQFDKILVSDFDLTFKGELDYDALLETRRLPGVDHAEPVFVLGCTLHHGHRKKKTGITGLQPGARLTLPRDSDGNAVVIPETGLLMSSMLAKILHARTGDELTLVPVRGDRRPLTVPIVRVVDNYLGLSAYASFDYLNRLVGEESIVTGVQLKINPAPASLNELYAELKHLPKLQSANDIRGERANLVNTLVGAMTASLVVVVAFAGIIFFGSILNSSLISLAEREREIATFRVLGYRPGEIGMIFLKESLIVNLTGSLIGLPLSYWLTSLMVRMYETELFRMPLVISPSAAFYTIGFALLFTFLSYGFVYRAILKMDWLQAMQAQE